jgi:hypothetical protein
MTQADVGTALGAALGGGYVNYFSIAGRSYKVIPQVLQVDRLNPSEVLNFYIRTPSGSMIPASTVAHVKYDIVPESINRFQQLNSATISGVAGVSQGEVLDFMRQTVKEVAPSGYTVDYSGASRQFMQESGGFLVTMAFAVIIVFLALAAQFESFRDPVVILVSVPLALFGAMVFIFLGFASMNIYTEVGLVTLMGRRGGEPSARGWQEQARRDPRSDRDPAAADPDDDGGDGVRRDPARDRIGRGRGGALLDGAGDFHRAVDRDAVHALRGAGDVHAAGGGAQGGGVGGSGGG